MADLIAELTRGNTTEVKVVLTSVIAALAVYQVVLMTVGWGRVKVGFLSQGAASGAHRAVGDTIVVLTLFVSIACLSYFGWDDGGLHAVAGVTLIAALAFKIAVVRWWHGLSRYLPHIGSTVFLLFILTFAASAGEFLLDD